MNKAFLLAGLGLLSAPVSAQTYVDPSVSRDIGRAVGQATVAAERAAEQARIAARAAIREAKRGFAEGVNQASNGGPPATAYGPMIRNEDEAVDACSIAAEDQGASVARLATVRDITDVRPLADGWTVDGVIDARDNWRDSQHRAVGFTCTIRAGEIADVRLHDYVARR